jgi:hypothetical protein
VSTSLVRRRPQLPAAILAVLSIAAFVLIYRKGLGTTFYYDEWNFVMNRGAWDLDTFLQPHNEHLSLVPVLIFKLLFETVGLDSYWVFRVLLVLAHLAVVALLFVYARRRVGDWLALAVAVLVLFLGAAWHDLLVPFQVSFVLSVAAGLGALLALERRDALGDGLACGLVAMGLASSSVGITFAVAVLAETLFRPARWRAIWIAGAPLVLYGLWSLGYGDPTATSGGRSLTELVRDNLPAVPGYVATAVAGAMGALIGIGIDLGRPLALAGAVALGYWLVRARVSPRLLALLAAGATYWGLGGVFRAHLNAPADSRYLYFGAILVLLIGLELARPLPFTWPLAAVLGIAVAAAALANFGALRNGSLYLQDWSRYVRVELAALELAGPSTDPAFRPDAVRAPDITAGKYFAAIERYDSSPAASPEEVAQGAEPERAAADATLLGALGVRLEPGRARTASCSRGAASLEVQVPPSGLAIVAGGSPVELRLRSFAAGYPEAAFATVPASTTSALRIPDRAAVTWRARLDGTGTFSTCRL